MSIFSHVSKFISITLSLVLFSTNTLLAHAPETNIWDQRRQQRQLAQLPQAFQPPQLLSTKYELRPARPAGGSTNKSPSFIRTSYFVNPPAGRAGRTLKPVVDRLSPQYGSIRHISEGSSDRIIIHVLPNSILNVVSVY